ncbi:hypothetical protein GXW82_36755 [Streptacidiphilus sp. 4-A2]|nr:hypothetical protein [Streptacidiphilus sp. 4-A2]
MTLALDRYKTTTVFQRCLIGITLRQQLRGLLALSALWLVPFLTVLYWLRWTEYPLTQNSPDAYGEGYYSYYWTAHWNHVGDFDSVLYGLVVLTSVACLLLLIPATTLIRRDLLVRLNVVLWTQGASPPSGCWPRWPYSALSSSSASAPPASSNGACCTGRRAVTCSSTTPTTPC